MKTHELLAVAILLNTWSPHFAESRAADEKQAKPEAIIGHVVLQKDIKIADKKKTGFQRLVGDSKFPLLGKDKIGDRVYYLLVIPDLDGYRRPALVPSSDQMGNPSVTDQLDTAVIAGAVGLQAYLGYYPLKAQLKLPVVSSASGKYVVRYTSYGCDEKLELAEADLVFTSIEQERAQERALEEAKQKREREERLAREKFVAEQKAKGLVEFQGSWMTPQQAAELEKQQLAEAKVAEAKRVQQQQMAQLFSSVGRDYFGRFDQRSFRSLSLGNGNTWTFGYSFGLQDAQTYIITVVDWNSRFRRMRNHTLPRNEIAVYAEILDRFSQWVDVAKTQNLTGIEKALGSTTGVNYKFVAPDKLVMTKDYESAEFDLEDAQHIRSLLPKAQEIESAIGGALLNDIRSRQIGSQLLK